MSARPSAHRSEPEAAVAKGTGATEPVQGASSQGTVVLDIGGVRGALVVWAPAGLDGSELEIRRLGAPWRGEHTAVRPRDLGSGRRFAAVFGSLDAGRYEIRVRGTGPHWALDTEAPPVLDAEVGGGTIAEVTWPTAPAA